LHIINRYIDQITPLIEQQAYEKARQCRNTTFNGDSGDSGIIDIQQHLFPTIQPSPAFNTIASTVTSFDDASDILLFNMCKKIISRCNSFDQSMHPASSRSNHQRSSTTISKGRYKRTIAMSREESKRVQLQSKVPHENEARLIRLPPELSQGYSNVKQSSQPDFPVVIADAV
jgi:hypothetical protein